jgi:hypothetical protein
LKAMITEIAKQNQVSDVAVENQVWRALQDFNPSEFLRMLRTGAADATGSAGGAGGAGASAQPPFQRQETPQAPQAQQAGAQSVMPQAMAPRQQQSGAYQEPVAAPRQPASAPVQPVQSAQFAQQMQSAMPQQSVMPQQPGLARRPDDLEIQIAPAAKEKRGLFGASKSKEEKPAKAPKAPKAPKTPKAAPEPKASGEKSGGGLFGRRKAPEQEMDIIQGAVASQDVPGFVGVMNQPPPLQPQQPAPYVSQAPRAVDGVTEMEIQGTGVARFRYVGNQDHPRTIEVPVAENGIFTIGRFDASLGRKQSDFEFDMRTRAVSRRHAVVERSASGYSIIDLNSSAGTFIDGQKIPPNTPCTLTQGSRVTFGNAGAEYVWES